MVKTALALILTIAGLGACVSKAKRPKAETALQALNGENYELPAQGTADRLVLPIVKQKERSVVVQGKVMMQAGLGAVPIQGVEIGLFGEDGRLLVSGTSGQGGEFSLPSPVKSGRYILKTTGAQYSGQYPLTMENYTVSGILFQVHKND